MSDTPYDQDTDPDFEDDFEDDFDEPDDMIPLKWIAEGSTTLNDVIANVQAVADLIRKAAEAGFELSQPVDNGFVFVVHPDGKRLGDLD